MANPASQYAVLLANYRGRAGAYLLALLVAVVSEWSRSRTPGYWIWTIGLMLSWPHIAHALARRSRDTRAAELRNVLFDAAAGGSYSAALGFAFWPTVAVLLPCLAVIFRSGGPRYLAGACLASVIGGLAGIGVFGASFRPETDVVTSALSIVLLVSFVLNFTAVARWQGGALRQGKRALDVALEQQSATSEVLRAITTARADLDVVFSTIIRSAVRLCGGMMGGVFRYDGELLHLVAHHNYSPEGLAAVQRAFPLRPTRESVTARAIVDRTVVNIPDMEEEPGYGMQYLSQLIGFRSMLAAPMMLDGHPVGVIAVGRREVGAFSVTDVELLKLFSDQAAIALDNARLFTELEARNGELTAALDRQTATSEVLRVITQSPGEVQAVFDAIVMQVKRLVEGYSVVLLRVVGDEVHCAAFTPTTATADAELRAWWPRPLADSSRHMLTVIQEGRAAFVRDIDNEPGVDPGVAAMARRRGYRSVLTAPILRDGRAFGALTVTRRAPSDFNEHETALIQTFADQAGIAIENARLLHELEDKKEQLERELDSAREIQLSMVPTEFPVPEPGVPVELHATLLPARQVGGDLYDFFWLDPDTLYFVVADVSGKGAPAALFMARAKTLLRTITTSFPGPARTVPRPHEIIARVNEELCLDNPFSMFVTLVMGILRPSSGELQFCNAGHPVPYVIRPGGEVRPLRGASAKPVGINPNVPYVSATAHLAAGDCLFAFTDGITESLDETGAFYEDERLEATLRALAGCAPRDVIAGVVDSVRRFGGAAAPADDIAALALRRVIPAVVELTLTNRPGDFERVVHAVDEFGAVRGVPRDIVADVNVALDEVLSNIVTHAYADADAARHEIHVRLTARPDSLEVEVEDDGIAFDPTSAAPAPPPRAASVRERAAGRLGLHFVSHLMDEVLYARVGERNRLRLRKSLRKTAPAR